MLFQGVIIEYTERVVFISRGYNSEDPLYIIIVILYN